VINSLLYFGFRKQMKIRLPALFFLHIILALSVSTFASNLSDSLYFQVINMKDGLPGSTILDFEQDSLGFIWIATNDGLCRYDGTSFKVFKHEPHNEKSLWNNFVQNLYIDKKENLWVMTTNGLNLFDLEQQTMVRIVAGSDSGGLLDNSPTDICQTSNGTVFVSSYYSGISYQTQRDERFSYLTDNLPNDTKLSSSNINCLELLFDSLLFIGYRDAGIDIYNINSNSTQSLEFTTGTKLLSDNIKVICKNKNQGLWIGTNAGLSYYDVSENSILNYPYDPTKKSFIVDHEILSLFADNNGNLWIGTRQNGLVIVRQEDVLLDGNTAAFTQYLPSNKLGSLSYRTVLKIFKDTKGLMWIGTHGGGINLVESKNRRFDHLYHTNGDPLSLSNNKVWGITEDMDENIWIGTDGDGINVWNQKEGIIENYRNNQQNPSSLSDNAIISALTDNKGQIWLGTYEGGLNRFNPANNSFIQYKASEALPVNDVRCIYEDQNQNLWIGMNRGGIARYNPVIDKFEAIDITSNYDIRSIFSIGETLWLGTYSFGLIKYHSQNHTLETFDVLNNTPGAPPIQTIYSIYSHDSRILWCGTDNIGLCRI